MRPLFIIGNKRSGTSQLVRILNLHPEIFIAHESDIIWILHQFYRQEPFDYSIYTLASPDVRVPRHVERPTFVWKSRLKSPFI